MSEIYYPTPFPFFATRDIPIIYNSSITDNYNNYPDLLLNKTSEELNEIKKQVNQEEKNYYDNSRTLGGFMGETKWDSVRNKIEKVFVENNHPEYKQEKSPVITSDTEIINGFQLYACKNNTFSIELYEELVKLYNSEKKYTFEEWKEIMDDECCTEWNKMDEHGESYGGYWKYDKKTPEYKFAWRLSFDKNCKCMFDLPFSKDLLLKTIQIGCNNYSESVRYSNFLCICLERKLAAIARNVLNDKFDGYDINLVDIIVKYLTH